MNAALNWGRSLLENFAYAGVLVDQSGVLALEVSRRIGPTLVVPADSGRRSGAGGQVLLG